MLPEGTILPHPCPECGARMVLRRSRYGLFYGCERWPTCKGTHGAHAATGEPLGFPADQETKAARIRAHDWLDRLWLGPTAPMRRREAYRWMREAMGLSREEAHVGRFTRELCARLVALIREREGGGKVNEMEMKGADGRYYRPVFVPFCPACGRVMLPTGGEDTHAPMPGQPRQWHCACGAPEKGTTDGCTGDAGESAARGGSGEVAEEESLRE